jgi:hypothetical protein
MFRLYVRLGVISLLPLIVAALLIHAKRHPDNVLRQLLSENCPKPCFMGIRPGVTTRHEFIQLLKANNQFDIATPSWDDANSGTPIVLSWNKDQPPLIRNISQITVGFQKSDPKKVAQILLGLQPNLTLSDFYLAFGKPSRFMGAITDTYNTYIKTRSYQVRVLYFYDEYNLSFSLTSKCPVNWARLLQEPVRQIEYDTQMRVDGTKPIASFRINALCL